MTETKNVMSSRRSNSTQCVAEEMDTGYRIEESFIWGPETPGLYWINDGYIWGPKNAGKYRVENGRIYGPGGPTEFWINNSHIYGPNRNLPWLE